ncbi:MAG TPA: MFS transporter, partial [Actinobacteria bacterium]|nr:MFS transporter [Actinomycetota bacterium]
MSRTGDSDAVTVAPEPDDQLEAGDPFDADDVRALQRKSIGVLGGSQVLGGVAVAGSLPAGALIAESISGSEAAAGLAQTFGVVGAALLALPLARVALSRGRRVALASGYFLGSLGSIIVIFGAVYRSLAIVYAGCLLVGVASAAGLQARYAATDLASANRRARSLSIVVWGATIGA